MHEAPTKLDGPLSFAVQHLSIVLDHWTRQLPDLQANTDVQAGQRSNRYSPLGIGKVGQIWNAIVRGADIVHFFRIVITNSPSR